MRLTPPFRGGLLEWQWSMSFFATSQAEIMTLCRLLRSVKCWSDLGDRLLITNVGTMSGNTWPNLIPTVEKVIY